MKKIILFFVASMLGCGVFAQNESYSAIDATIFFKGGYNVLEKHPLYSVSFVGEIGFIRFAFELQHPDFGNYNRKITYSLFFSPSIGLCYGQRSIIYLMAGVQPWVSFDETADLIVDCQKWRPKLEAGCDIRLCDWLFVNLSALYIIPFKDASGYHDYRNLAFLCGLGFRF